MAYQPRAGTLAEVVFDNRNKTVPEISAAAEAKGLNSDPKTITTTLSQIKYRIKNNYSQAKRKPAAKAKRKPAAKAKRKPAEAAKASAPPARRATADAQLQLRKLIFEMGFVAARAIFDEFSSMHARMK